jgi:hypothetical protein
MTAEPATYPGLAIDTGFTRRDLKRIPIRGSS